MPGMPRSIPNAGIARATSRPALSARLTTGRRMIARAAAAQNPLGLAVVPAVAPAGQRDAQPVRRRRRSDAARPGSSVSAAATAAATTKMAPAPRLVKIENGTTSMPVRAKTTVPPLNSTARPAVAPVRATAASRSRPAAVLLAEARDDQQRVVDAHGEAHHRDDVEREDRHVEALPEDRRQGARRRRSRPAPARRGSAPRPPSRTRTAGSRARSGSPISSARRRSDSASMPAPFSQAALPVTATEKPSSPSASRRGRRAGRCAGRRCWRSRRAGP